ncbi:MAG TPA: hypothetical protein DDY68_03345 [Porphyromonadaceae bacterium]|nr:hypothetical protein [Porphyromonadaceae bacterium]
MKKFLSLGTVLFALLVGFSSCKKEDGEIISVTEVGKLTGDAALNWAKLHKDSLLNVITNRLQNDKDDKGNFKYKTTNGYINNPDITREVFISIGYDGLNVAGYLSAGAFLDSCVVTWILNNGTSTTPKKALLVSGNSSSGKSTCLKNTPELKGLKADAHFVSDQTFENISTLRNMIDTLKNRGFEYSDITIVLVYCDALTSYKSACDRLIKEGRTISLDYFTYMYPCFKGRIDSMEKMSPYNQCVRRYINNMKFSYKEGDDIETVPKEVTYNQGVLPWCYTLEDHNKTELYSFAYGFQESASWSKYPTEDNTFRAVRNEEKARRSLIENLEY